MSTNDPLDAAVAVAVQRALADAPQLVIRNGTLEELETNGTYIHDVIIDGDTEPIGAHDITHGDVIEGDRVTVLFAPPHQALIVGLPITDSWHVVGDDLEPPFSSGWGHSTADEPLDNESSAFVSFKRRGQVVELRGRAFRASGSDAEIFILPEGYRPRNNLNVPAIGSILQPDATITIRQTGPVRLSIDGGGNTVNLDGISFTLR